MQLSLTGKRALVAGGSRGIGLAIAHAFALAGADVAICARAKGPLEKAESSLRSTGRKISAHSCDLADGDAVKAWVIQAAADLGGVDILVNNASGFGRTDDEAGWATSISVDLMAAVRASQTAMPFLLKNGGNIIHISSISGLKASVRTPPYGAVKAAIMEYAQTQALTHAAHKIRVNCIAPGFIASPMTDGLNEKQKEAILATIPAAKLGSGEDIAAALVYLASREAAYVTGQTLHVNGGMAMI